MKFSELRPVIKISNLVFYYLESEPVISDLSLEIRSDKINVLSGPNGIGKTTLVKLISGELEPKAGEITVSSLKSQQDRIKQCTVVSQTLIPFPDIKLQEYLDLLSLNNMSLTGLRIYSIKHIQTENDLIAKWYGEIKGFLDVKCREIPLEIFQKAELFMALLGQRNVILLDEPFVNLDDATKKEFLLEIEQLINTNIIIVLVTHKFKDLRGDKFLNLIPHWNKGDIAVNINSSKFKIKYFNYPDIRFDNLDRFVISNAEENNLNILYFDKLSNETKFIKHIYKYGIYFNKFKKNGNSSCFHIPKNIISILGTDRYKYNAIPLLSIRKNFEIIYNIDNKFFSRIKHNDKKLKELLKIADVKYSSIYSSFFTLSGGNKHRFLLMLISLKTHPYIYIEEPLAGIYDLDYQLIVDLLIKLSKEKTVFIGISSEYQYNYLKNYNGEI